MSGTGEAAPWLLVCGNPPCKHEWDAPGDGPPGPATRCPLCLNRRPVAYPPARRARSPKGVAARKAAKAKAKAATDARTASES